MLLIFFTLVIRLFIWEVWINRPRTDFDTLGLLIITAIAITIIYITFFVLLVSLNVKNGLKRIAVNIGLLTLGLMLGLLIPYPQPRPSWLQLHFEQYRTDYEAFAAQHNNATESYQDCTDFRTQVDGRFASLSLDCIDMIVVSASSASNPTYLFLRPNLWIRFYPIDPVQALYYSRDADNRQCAGIDGYVTANLDDHWYVCALDWP